MSQLVFSKTCFHSCLVVASIASESFFAMSGSHVLTDDSFGEINFRAEVTSHFYSFQMNHLQVCSQISASGNDFLTKAAGVRNLAAQPIITFPRQRVKFIEVIELFLTLIRIRGT